MVSYTQCQIERGKTTMKNKTAAPVGDRLPAVQKRKPLIDKRVLTENISMMWMVLPGLVAIFLFWAMPIPMIVIGFKDFKAVDGIWASDWNGLGNLAFFLESDQFGRTMRNTLLYGIGFIITGLITSVGLALMFYFLRSSKALKFYNTTVILPRFMSAVIVAFVVYGLLHPAAGIFNKIIIAFGGDPIKWYQEAKYWPYILFIVHTWTSVGMGSVMYYAQLIGLDPTLMEAAEIDGANRVQQIRHVILPHMLPMMITLTILNIGHVMGGDIGLFYQVPKMQGILFEWTDIINTFTYRALIDGNLEKSAAVGIFQSVIGLILVIGTNMIVKKISPENSMF